MIIEYDTDNFTVEEEVTIDDVKHRIVLFDTGFYGLQSKNYKGEWETWLVSTKQNVREVIKDEDDENHFIIGIESIMGKVDLASVLEAYKSSFKLRNGEYWNLELTIEGLDDDVLTEVISREEGEDLLSSIKNFHELMLMSRVNDMGRDYYNYLIISIVVIYTLLVICMIFIR